MCASPIPAGSAPALADVDFDVPAGATVALVGPSGAGKTTIANLLLRFWDPEQGAIRLDGVDLRELTLDDLRGRIALVAQDTYLFNDTLEANVRLARPDATREEIETALRQAALAEFVADLPEGLQTRVGERGVQLSGGQRQRIAIARAFLKDAPILMLDEATSHLDTISEQLVRSALDALMANRTTIVVAHRLSTIQAADVILVLNAGPGDRGRHARRTAPRGAASMRGWSSTRWPAWPNARRRTDGDEVYHTRFSLRPERMTVDKGGEVGLFRSNVDWANELPVSVFEDIDSPVQLSRRLPCTDFRVASTRSRSCNATAGCQAADWSIVAPVHVAGVARIIRATKSTTEFQPGTAQGSANHTQCRRQ